MNLKITFYIGMQSQRLRENMSIVKKNCTLLINGMVIHIKLTRKKRANAKQVRDDARQEKVADCSELFDIIRKHGFFEYCQLVDFLQSQKPDLLGGLLCNAYAVKSYLDSLRAYNSHDTDEHVKSLIAQVKRQNRYIKQLESTIEGLQYDYKTIQEEYCEEVQQLCQLYEMATGETLPEYSTIAEYGKTPTYKNQNAEIGRK